MITARYIHDAAIDLKARDFDDPIKRAEVTNVECSACLTTALHVNWINSPYTGGYCKVTCPGCGAERVLIDDYS